MMLKRVNVALGCVLGLFLFSLTAEAGSGAKRKCQEYKGKNVYGDWSACKEYVPILGTDYMIDKKNIYWVRRQFFESVECGAGGSGGLGNIFRPICWTPMGRTRYEVERRAVALVAPRSPGFRPLKGSVPQLLNWQQDQLADYAVDESAAYFQEVQLEGANPKKFSVIFPFGDDEKWRRLQISRSERLSFVRGDSIGEVDWDQFVLIEPVICPGQDAACGSEGLERLGPRPVNELFGAVGKDIFFIGAHGSARLNGKLSSDTFIFSDFYGTYLFASGVLYKPAPNGKELVEARESEYSRMRRFHSEYLPVDQPVHN